MNPETRIIAAEETVPIRWRVLRPGFPRETAIFPGDSEPTTFHVGVFLDCELSGVASVYEASCPVEPGARSPMQLRGMATIPEVRGKGCGHALLIACTNLACERGCDWIWCNARASAVPFYARFGWEKRGAEFEIPTVGPHFHMVGRLDQAT
jgi:GNAT superfamily N-acetyltransferase